jgi:mono/diheme cytochrome c family protein
MKIISAQRNLYLITSALFSFMLSACSFSLAADITPPPGSEQTVPPRTQPVEISGPLYPLVPPNPDNGEPIFVEKCAPCHGENGNGDGPQAAQLPNPVAALASQELARSSTPEEWYTQVTQGNLERFMPPFNSLSDRQRWDVVAYSFSLSVSESDLALGAELYQANCARCHGMGGRGDGPEAVDLPVAPPDLTDQAQMAATSAAQLFQVASEGISPNMPAFGGQLSEDELWALTAFLRSLTFKMLDESPVAAELTPTPESSALAQGDASETPDKTELSGTPVAEMAMVSGTVTGEVTNDSGGDVPGGLIVTLHGFDDMMAVYTQTTTLSDDGSYLFEDVEMPDGRVYLVTVEFGETAYGSDIGVVQPDMPTMDLPVSIYETTTDASILSADRLHIFFEFLDEETVRVVELYIISNLSDQTLVPAEGDGMTVRFTLPDAASNLEFQDGILGGRYVQTADGFGDTVSVRPGSGVYEMMYAYEMPYNRQLDLEHQMLMPVGAVVVLVPKDGIKISGDNLQDSGTREVQGELYHLYNGGDLEAGDNLSITISGRPSTGSSLSLSTTANTSTNLIIGLAFFGVALVVAGVWLFQRSRKSQPEDEQGELFEASVVAQEVVEDDPDTLMDAIIALDDQYQAGQLPEDAYLKRRAELKECLQEMLGEDGS